MTHEELILDALSYRRHTGSTLGDIRTFIQLRELEKHTQKEDRDVLRRLEEHGVLNNVGKKWYFSQTAFTQAKGSALKPEWQPADPWILLAILYCRNDEAIRLSRIIAVADSINHAIPTLEEMHGALNRFAAGRLLKVKRDTFFVTERAVQLLAKVEATCSRRVLEQVGGLRRILDCPCCGVTLRSVNWKIALDSATLHAAYEAYLNAFK